jgi:hypothetical protein
MIDLDIEKNKFCEKATLEKENERMRQRGR